MVDTIFSNVSKHKLRAIVLQEDSKDKAKSKEERKELKRLSRGAMQRAKAIEKRRKEIVRKLEKLSKKKVQSKRTFKKSKTTLHLKQPEVSSILGDTNRFFKDEMEEAKNALFFK